MMKNKSSNSRVVTIVGLIWAVFIVWVAIKVFNNMTTHQPAPGYNNYSAKKQLLPRNKEAAGEAKQPSQVLLPVRALEVNRTALKDSLPVLGTIRGGREIIIKPTISGTVTAINFKEGERVHKGDIIATLDQSEAKLKLEYAKNKLAAAQASYKSMLKRLEAYQHLYKVGAIIKERLEEAKLKAQSAAFELKTVEDQVKLAQKYLQKTVIRAPSEGFMGPRQTEVGEFVTPQDKIGYLLGINEVLAEAGIIERNIAKIRLGEKVRVHVDAYPDRTFEGKITRIFPILEGKTRTLTIDAKINNPDNLLLPGMFARIEIIISNISNALVVPSECIIKTKKGPVVPVITNVSLHKEGENTGLIRLRKVKLGYQTTDYVQVLSGIEEKDLVVLEAQGEIKDNVKVIITSLDKNLP